MAGQIPGRGLGESHLGVCVIVIIIAKEGQFKCDASYGAHPWALAVVNDVGLHIEAAQGHIVEGH